MRMMKAVLPRLWRLTRTASIVLGVAMMLAFVAGVASLAVAKTPSSGTTATSLLKGVENISSTLTTLTRSGAGPALGLKVGNGSLALEVNSDAGTSTNLSADKLEDPALRKK